MKKIAVFALAATFVLQHLLVIILFASFEANRDYIATVLCINREDPESNCDGQCFFMQKLQESHQQSGHQMLLEKNGVEFVEQTVTPFDVISPEVFPGIRYGSGKDPIYSFRYHESPERPPAV